MAICPWPEYITFFLLTRIYLAVYIFLIFFCFAIILLASLFKQHIFLEQRIFSALSAYQKALNTDGNLFWKAPSAYFGLGLVYFHFRAFPVLVLLLLVFEFFAVCLFFALVFAFLKV